MVEKWGIVLPGVVAIALLVLPAGASGATINVTTKNDEFNTNPGKCSVREAVQAANTDSAFGGCAKGSGDADTIELGPRRISLTIPTTNEDANTNGDLDVRGDKLTFRGEGDGVTDVSTTQADRVVDVHDATSVAFEKMMLRGGDVSSFGAGTGRGGNLRSEWGNVTLKRTTIRDGTAFVGGGLYVISQGDPALVKVTRSTFALNTATGAGGGMDVYQNVETKVSKSTFTENTTVDPTDNAEAGAILSRGVKLTVSDTEFVDNFADGGLAEPALGGAIKNENGSELRISRSLFYDNSARGGTGFFEGGGAIWTSAGTAPASITNTTFEENDGESGAAVHVNSGSVIITHATLHEHSTETTLDQDGGYILHRNSIFQGPDPCEGTSIDSGGYSVSQTDDLDCDFQPTDDTTGELVFKTDDPVDNGGFTRTLALKKTSEGIDFVPKAQCGAANKEDQRGYRRKGPCDSGAYEFKGKKPLR